MRRKEKGLPHPGTERQHGDLIVPDGVIPSPFRGMGCRLRAIGQLAATLNSPEKEKGPRHSMHSAIRPRKSS
jgi:hypothetical protein